MAGANLQPPTEGVCLTKSLIVQRNIPVEKEDPETISEALTSLQVLRLDRERISCIANLPELKHVHSIYLQQNQIKKIENLNCFPNLKEYVLAALPHLIELDNKGISKQKVILQNNEEEENSSEESDYEDCPELFEPLSTEKDFFVDVHNEFSSRSAWRRETAMREHEARLEELRQRQNLTQLVFNTSEGRTELLSLPVLNNLPQTENHTVLNPPQRTVNPAVDAGLNIPKEKNEGTTQQKISKGKISSAAKTANKNIRK
ncbi:leucine-rich repeat-containing protein 46 isoform X2 [Pseudonaja textilis]|uniref:leucine-rich repeat-containing protein 46 isoform X2 n=1 Tax=Pseudonaja textilis TaxID=8673 RepID=UPI000EAA5710|nr:leucine-rich repeat-containing protein 46 isoform X2 [Pseudonaja textilis]